MLTVPITVTCQRCANMIEVLETARKVSEQSRLVHIDPDAVTRFARMQSDESIEIPGWDTFCHYEGPEKTVVSYILVLDTINFCFWPGDNKKRWGIDVEGQRLSGYYGMAAALKQAFESGTPLTNAEYLENLSQRDLETILDGSGSLQLLEERTRNINELGSVLISRYGGEAVRLIEAAQGSAVALARTVANQLPSYNDAAHYNNDTVYFYKRAQILAADLHGALNGAGWGCFNDIQHLTAFADYKLPQVLRSLGILHYSPDLANKVDNRVLLETGSPEEVEIRANTIWAVETMCRELRLEGKELKAHQVDWLLWKMGQEKKYRTKPYHRTRTIYY